MPSLYSLIYCSPIGRIEAEADNFEELSTMIPERLVDLLSPELIQDIDGVAKLSLNTYRRSRFLIHKVPQKTSLEKFGLELDVIKCFLNGLSIMQTLNHIVANNGIRLSASSIGRFFCDLRRFGIRSLEQMRC